MSGEQGGERTKDDRTQRIVYISIVMDSNIKKHSTRIVEAIANTPFYWW